MKKLFLILLVTMTSFALFAQGQGETTEKQVKNYTFGGSSTVAPIAKSAIPEFEKENPSVKLGYETLGSSTGIKQLIAGTLSLAGSSRELKSSEVDQNCVPTTIALDGLSVGVNSSVNVSNLSIAQLAAIFSGEITNWSEVGGKDMKIELIERDETSGTYGSFNEIVLDSQGKEPTKNAIIAKENGEVATKIASTPGSIGYIGMAFNSIITNAGGKILSIDGVDPTPANVLNKSYPISRALYVVTIGEPKDGTVEKDFIDFLLSRKGQSIVEECEFIPLN
ncbi:MAG: phosphate ABC transporter substrate-binding protein [Pleomorphochaeta sp.]|jgi:phosphate transport system substrate-binding protein